jgi:uncharacterized integral membrane protein (TIGR00697 family)
MTRSFRYYDLILGAFVAVLLCSNLIGPAKVVMLDLPLLGPTQFGAGNLFFPLSYIFGDILTEVYGYALARRVIWAGFGALLFATVMTWVILALPASPNEPFSAQLQPALETCFGGGWRIALGSIVAFCVGDFLNSYVLAKMKVRMGGRHPWARFIGSTGPPPGSSCSQQACAVPASLHRRWSMVRSTRFTGPYSKASFPERLR